MSYTLIMGFLAHAVWSSEEGNDGLVGPIGLAKRYRAFILVIL